MKTSAIILRLILLCSIDGLINSFAEQNKLFYIWIYGCMISNIVRKFTFI